VAGVEDVTATFEPLESISVALAGSGSGLASGSDPVAGSAISCPGSCSGSYPADTTLTLSAAPSSGSTFAGWSGGGCTGTGTCNVSVEAAATVTATFDANPTLTVALAGSGSGTVTGTDLDCPGLCSSEFPSGTSETLTATPDAGSTFAGWSGGGCSGTATCTVAVSSAETVTATFTATEALTVAITGSGTGAVGGAGGISCPGTCIASFPSGTSEALAAFAATGSVFAGWSGGGCSGTGTCTVALSSPQTVTAYFVAEPTLAIAITGPGSGAVTGSRIACPGQCSSAYPAGTAVKLTATPRSGSTFGGWSGAGCTGTSTCTVTVAQQTTVTATFTSTDTGSLKPISPVSLGHAKQPKLSFGSNGKGSVAISCGGSTACRGKAVLSVDQSGRAVSLAHSRFKLRGRRSKAVTLSLARTVQTALFALPHHTMLATLTIRTAAGQVLVEPVKVSVAKPRSSRARKHKR
jgi:hypothetical protein